jgi:membrane associated rhomboid family serine protease
LDRAPFLGILKANTPGAGPADKVARDILFSSLGAPFMGLENRDYIRDGSYTASLADWGVDFTPVVKYLIIVNVVVFLLQIFVTRAVPFNLPGLDGIERDLPKEAEDPAGQEGKNGADRQKRDEAVRKARELMEKMQRDLPSIRISVIQEWFELSPEKTIEEGQLWRLVTSAFCHDRYGIWHILFNMLALYWFGTRLERMYGSREFLFFYLTAAVCSSLAYVGLAYYSASNAPAIGASGAVMGVMMLYVIYYPFETFLLFWVIPVPLWVLLGIYVLYDLHPVLLMLAGDQFFTGVAHAGHLGGLAFGFLYWRFNLRLEAAFDFRWQGTRRRKPAPFREPVILALPSRDEFADRVDEILKKISEQGKESLTDEERNILIEASQKYRNKE